MNLKNSLLSFAIIILAFFAPIGPLLLMVGGAIMFDTIFGIMKAYKKKEKITSRKMSAVISKMFLYQFSVLGMFILDKYLVGDLIAIFTSIPLVLTKLVVATLLSIELKSINENVEAAYNINLWNSFKKMLARAKEVKEEVEQIIDKKEDESK